MERQTEPWPRYQPGEYCVLQFSRYAGIQSGPVRSPAMQPLPPSVSSHQPQCGVTRHELSVRTEPLGSLGQVYTGFGGGGGPGGPGLVQHEDAQHTIMGEAGLVAQPVSHVDEFTAPLLQYWSKVPPPPVAAQVSLGLVAFSEVAGEKA